MDKKQRLQVRILLLCVKIIGGIHLTEEFKNDLDEIKGKLKDMTK